MVEDDIPLAEQEAEAKRVAEGSLRENGFLSPWIDKFVPHYREMDQGWMDYTDALNRCGQKMALANDNVVVGRTSLDPICIGFRMLLRALGGFQGAVLLAQRGMTQESATLTRGVYESGFWLGYLFKDGPGAATAIVADEKRSQHTYLKILRKELKETSPEIAELDAKIQATEAGRMQKIDDLARLSGFPDHYRFYKKISAQNAHTSLHSLNPFMKRNADGSYSGHITGPDQEGIKQALSYACNAISMNIAAFSMLIGGTAEDNEFRSLLEEYRTLGPKHP